MRCSFAGYYRGAAAERWLIEDDLYLIKDHKPQEPALHKLRINIGELTARAHERGFDDLSDVETAVLYPNGTIYMKGGESTDSARLNELLQQVQALRQEVAALRR